MNKVQTANLQDLFLNQVRKDNIGVTIYLVGGVQLKGYVRGFDAFTVILESPGKPAQLVYKHAIASVVPLRSLGALHAREEPPRERPKEEPREEPTEELPE
jgi:host factor-I protein